MAGLGIRASPASVLPSTPALSASPPQAESATAAAASRDAQIGLLLESNRALEAAAAGAPSPGPAAAGTPARHEGSAAAPANGTPRSPAEQSGAERLARERLREAELALESQQRVYKAHIADLTAEMDALGVGARALGGALAETDAELARKEGRLRELRADFDGLAQMLAQSAGG